MKMLTNYQIDLIHREIDGENTHEESVEVRKLVETQPEALALITSLRDLDTLLSEVPARDTPLRVKERIHQELSMNSKLRAQQTTQSITSWASQQWKGVTNLMEELMSTKKVLIIATTAVAVIAIVGQAVVGYEPSVFDAGTVGAGNGMTGVQQAGRYKGKTMTEADVTLSNPEIGALFQNDLVLKLVKSEVFQLAMHDNAFRELQANPEFLALFQSDAFQQLMQSDAYEQLMTNDAYHQIMVSDAYQQLLANDVFVKVLATDSYQQIMASEAYQQLQATPAYHQILSSDAFLKVLANDNFRQIMSNDAYQQLLASDVFVRVLSNDAFHDIMANDAYQQLLSNDAFRVIAQNASLSEAFLAEANRVQ